MRFKATEAEVQQIAAKAIEASKPAELHLFPPEMQADYPKIQVDPHSLKVQDSGLFLEYVEGRCIKLRVYRLTEDEWRIPEIIFTENHSWLDVYPTSESLILAVLSEGNLMRGY